MLTQRQIVGKNSMPPTKIRAFFQEFPKVRERVIRGIAQAYVSRVEPDLLNYSPDSEDVGVELGDWVYEELLLLDENFELVTASFNKLCQRRKCWFFGPKISYTKTVKVTGKVRGSSTVNNVLDNLGEEATRRVHFIFSYWRYTDAVILYKSPKGLSVGEWIKKQIESERSNLQKTSANIDAEASRTVAG
jgi:hypothetical protein